MRFLFLCSICLSSSLVHFKNGSGYFIRRGCPSVYHFKISAILIDSSCLLVLLRYSVLILPSISTCLIISAFYIAKYLSSSSSSCRVGSTDISDPLSVLFPIVHRSICRFHFFPSIRIFSWIGTSILSVMCHFPLLIICMAWYFYVKFHSYVLTVYSYNLY